MLTVTKEQITKELGEMAKGGGVADKLQTVMIDYLGVPPKNATKEQVEAFLARAAALSGEMLNLAYYNLARAVGEGLPNAINRWVQGEALATGTVSGVMDAMKALAPAVTDADKAKEQQIAETLEKIKRMVGHA